MMQGSSFFVFLIFLVPLSVSAENIKTDSVCQNLPRPKLQKELTALVENRFFPTTSLSIDKAKKLCLTHSQNLSQLSDNAEEMNRADVLSPVPATLHIAAELTANIKEMIRADLLEFQKSQRMAKTCAIVLATTDTPDDRLTPECRNFKQVTIPMLNQRLKLMRVHLAMKTVGSVNKDTKWDAVEIRHSLFEDTQKMKHGPLSESLKLKRLTRDEIMLAKNLSENQRENPEVIYSALMSQSPILLNFSGPEVTPKELVHAFETPPMGILEIESKTQELDYVLYKDYLKEVLKKIPVENRADYCLVANEMQKRDRISPELKLTVGLAGLGYVTSTGVAAILQKRFLEYAGTFINKSALVIDGVLAAISANSSRMAAEEFQRGLAVCQMAKFVENNTRNALCDFNQLQNSSAEAENSFFYLPIYGSSTVYPQIRKLRD